MLVKLKKIFMYNYVCGRVVLKLNLVLNWVQVKL